MLASWNLFGRAVGLDAGICEEKSNLKSIFFYFVACARGVCVCAKGWKGDLAPVCWITGSWSFCLVMKACIIRLVSLSLLCEIVWKIYKATLFLFLLLNELKDIGALVEVRGWGHVYNGRSVKSRVDGGQRALVCALILLSLLLELIF